MIRRVLLKFLCPETLRYHLHFHIVQETVEWMLQKWLNKTKKRAWIPLRWTLGISWFGREIWIPSNSRWKPTQGGPGYSPVGPRVFQKNGGCLCTVRSGVHRASRSNVCLIGHWKACTSAFGVAGTGSSPGNPSREDQVTARAAGAPASLAPGRRPTWPAHPPGGGVGASLPSWAAGQGRRWRACFPLWTTWPQSPAQQGPGLLRWACLLVLITFLKKRD